MLSDFDLVTRWLLSNPDTGLPFATAEEVYKDGVLCRVALYDLQNKHVLDVNPGPWGNYLQSDHVTASPPLEWDAEDSQTRGHLLGIPLR